MNAVDAAVQRMDEQAENVDTWLAQRKASRKRNALAEVQPYRDFATTMAEGDAAAKEAAREVLKKAGVTDETFEKAWETEP
jgi:hypothetical protein